LERTLFILAHLHVLHPIIVAHLICVFPSLANDMHIVGLASHVVHVFYNYKRSFQHWGFQQGLDHSISLPFGFLILNMGFCILGTLVRSRSFIESFVAKAFHEDLGRYLISLCL
jgi:hypothetical protein